MLESIDWFINFEVLSELLSLFTMAALSCLDVTITAPNIYGA